MDKMSRSIAFLEQMLKVATKEEDVEFLVSLLFDLKRDQEQRGNFNVNE